MMGFGALWIVLLVLLVAVFAVVAVAPGRRDTNAGPQGRSWLPALLGLLAVLLVVGLIALGTGWPGGGTWWGPMGGHMDRTRGGPSTSSTTPEAIPDGRELTVELTEMAFEPDTIEVTVGEPVELTVANVGQAYHDLTIDELDLRVGVEPGETVTTALRVDEPGSYDVECSVPGHAAAGMRATLTAVAP